MRKLFATFAILGALTLTGSPIAQAASAKPGATCSKLGATQTVVNKKFTCVKSGKKLVWNKGAAIVAKPAPSQTPIEVAPVINLDNLDKNWTTKVAQAAVLNKLASLPEATTSVELISGPNVLESEKALELELVKPAPKLFQEYYAPDIFKIVLFSNMDADWADEQFAKYGLTYQSVKVSESIKNFPGQLCNFAGVNLNREKIYFECSDSKKSRNVLNYQNPVHEFFHLVEAQMARGSVLGTVPVWMFEGSAAFFGEIVGYRNQSNPLKTRIDQNLNTSFDFDPDNEGFSQYRFRSWTKTASAAEVTRLFKILETNRISNGNKYAYYSLGSIATEALVASFGFDGYMKVWTGLKQGLDFQASFKQAFGISPDEFYVKLTPFVNAKF